MEVKVPRSAIAIITTTVESRSSARVGQVAFLSSATVSPAKMRTLRNGFFIAESDGRTGGTRTPNRRFWRPLLYQLSYCPSCGLSKHSRRGPDSTEPRRQLRMGKICYSMISVTRPAPMVRPPSRMAKRWAFSIAMGAMRLITMLILSPGMTISTPSGRSQTPVTSVVRK